MKYDYIANMVKDIEEVFDNYEFENIEDKDKLREEMQDKLWTDDSVTGNGSGSYTVDRNLAKEYVFSNLDLNNIACSELFVPYEEIGKRFLNEDWEYFDVCIRCYLLGEAIDRFLQERG